MRSNHFLSSITTWTFMKAVESLLRILRQLQLRILILKSWSMISNISHAVSLNYLQKQIEDWSDTDYRNEVVNTSLDNICIESSKEISNFDFDFNALNVSINKNVKATPLANKTNPIKIREQNFHSSNEKISISTGVFNSKSTNKYCSDSKGKKKPRISII